MKSSSCLGRDEGVGEVSRRLALAIASFCLAASLRVRSAANGFASLD